jgi:hypothetical protein
MSQLTNAPDEWALFEPSLEVLDRSTLELYATCPAQARLIDAKACVRESSPMLVGTEAHDVFSHTLRTYLSAPHEFNPYEVREILVEKMMGARPDVQPQVVDNIRRVIHDWARFIVQDMHHDNVLRYDGGDGECSGQLAHDLPHLECRVTSELDLLYSGPSPDVLHEIDYKTGFTPHNAKSVKDSFQFQMHAALVFVTYPDIQALETQVWRTFTNQRTYRVVFERRDLMQYMGRITAAAKCAMTYRQHPPAKAPAWPEQSKCGLCPVSHLCPLLECHPSDPVGMLEKLIVVENAEAELRTKLIAAAKSRDIVTERGDRFTAVMPKSTAKWKVAPAKQVEPEADDSVEG